MCCKSKPKPVTQTTTNPQLTSKLPTSNNIPKSTIYFNANDFEHAQLTNQSSFAPTTRLNQFEADTTDRLQDYCVENNLVKQSRLIKPKQLLTYELDRQDGISAIPIINTFHYQSTLNHIFSNSYNPRDTINKYNGGNTSTYNGTQENATRNSKFNDSRQY